jgi:CysZ protein
MGVNMFAAFSLAVGDAFAPEQRRALMLSIGLALLLLAGLWIAASALLAGTQVSGLPWLDTVIDVLGSLAALIITWTLFPAMTMLVLGFFLDRIVAAIERAHYPGLPQARPIGIGAAIASGARLAALALVLNLVLLPLYLIPVVNLFVYYGLNGYLVGRDYFESIALRRLGPSGVRALWQWRRGTLVLAGAIIVLLLSLPVINLAAPLIGVAFMLHLFEGLRRRAPAKIIAGPRPTQ